MLHFCFSVRFLSIFSVKLIITLHHINFSLYSKVFLVQKIEIICNKLPSYSANLLDVLKFLNRMYKKLIQQGKQNFNFPPCQCKSPVFPNKTNEGSQQNYSFVLFGNFSLHYQPLSTPYKKKNNSKMLLTNKKFQFLSLILPETQSTTTKAPSVTRRAAVTSEEKSTCPGESIKLIKKPFSSFSRWSGFVMNCKSLSSSSKNIEIALQKKKKTHITL